MNESKPPSESNAPNSAAVSSKQPGVSLFLIWFGVVGLGLVVLLIAIVVGFGSSLNRQISELKKKGEPVSLADVRQRYAAIPAEQNAAIALLDVRAEIEAASREANLLIDSRASFEQPLTPQQASEADAFVVRQQPLLDQLRAAIRLPGYAPVIESDSIDAIDEFITKSADNRSVARLLRVQAEVLVARGDHDGAAEVGLDIIRFGHHLENTPTLLNYLVSLAVRQLGVMSINEALQSGDVRKGLREQLQKELGQVDPAIGFAEAMRTERAIAIDRTRNSRGSMALAALLKPTLKELQRCIDEVERKGLTWQTANPVGARPAMIPTDAAHRAAIRWIAQSRALRLLESLTARGESENTDLESLPLPPEVLIDPFTVNKSLMVKRENNGWTIYSVGPDGADQSGAGDDITIRMPTAAKPNESQAPDEESSDGK